MTATEPTNSQLMQGELLVAYAKTHELLVNGGWNPPELQPGSFSIPDGSEVIEVTEAETAGGHAVRVNDKYFATGKQIDEMLAGKSVQVIDLNVFLADAAFETGSVDGAIKRLRIKLATMPRKPVEC